VPVLPKGLLWRSPALGTKNKVKVQS